MKRNLKCQFAKKSSWVEFFLYRQIEISSDRHFIRSMLISHPLTHSFNLRCACVFYFYCRRVVVHKSWDCLVLVWLRAKIHSTRSNTTSKVGFGFQLLSLSCFNSQSEARRFESHRSFFLNRNSSGFSKKFSVYFSPLRERKRVSLMNKILAGFILIS